MKQLYLILFLIFSLQISAQNEQITISGEVKNDSLPVENIHIINLSSNIGTISDQFQVFKINVKLNDPILFSGIPYETKTIIITKEHLKNKFISVQLQIKINKLDEVIVKKYKNIFLIEENNSFHNVNAKTLNLPNAGKKPLGQIERKLNYIKKGGVIDQLYGIFSGTKRKLQKLQNENNKELSIRQKILNIRAYFQDYLFINTFHIPQNEINNFVTFCLSKDILNLFEEKKYLEIIDVFVNEGKNFNAKK